MAENKQKRKPDFVGYDGIAVWEGVDKNGNEFLSIKCLGRYFNVFPNQERE